MPRDGPASTEDRCTVHGVRPGDTLWDLAGRELGDPRRWPRIFAANRDVVRDPDLIVPGERLRVACEVPEGSDRR